jgi:hypothetical protein
VRLDSGGVAESGLGVKTVREIQGSKAESVLRMGDAGAVNTTNHYLIISYTAERDKNICNIFFRTAGLR